MAKVLVTAGCSFSECESEWIDTWPRHLARHLDVEHCSLGRGAVGNGYISRAVINEVSNRDPQNTVVAIQWSTWDRIDLRLEKLDYCNTDAEDQYNIRKGKDWPKYPVVWNDLNAGIQQEIHEMFPNLELLLKDASWNHRRGFTDSNFWTNISMLLDSKQYRDAYFLLYDDNISKQIYSLEHILRTQWFLESRKIPYIMMSIDDKATNFDVNSETAHLVNMLGYIIKPGIIDWTMANFGKQGFPKYPDMHPGTLQHKEYIQKIIIPYMESECLV